MIHH
jgi:hypothetical protein